MEALRDRRLKISLIHELNDPFEFLAVNLKNKAVRPAFNALKATLATKIGILCFSTDWISPLLWGHYADRHKGLCLGFDVKNEILEPMEYVTKRIVLDTDWLSNSDAVRAEIMRRLLRTKSEPWQYESEVRLFAELDQIDESTGHYFKEFASDLKLAQVIVGASSNLTKHHLTEAFGSEISQVKLTKARAAFKSFNIVPDKRGLR